jgi:hypothetical protein
MFWHTSVVMRDGAYMDLAYEWKSWFPPEKGDIYFDNSLKQQSTGWHRDIVH